MVLYIFAVISIIAGAIFIQQGITKYILIKQLATTERVTIGLSEEQIKSGESVDSLRRMQTAGDIIRSHRQKIAQTYGELLGDGRFDPTNPKHLLYSQAINLENYLYLGVLSFGTIYLMMGIGAFIILMGISLIFIGSALRRIP
ncbi:MAG: hypothetical protein ABIJ37_00485 [Pseudomonadota bacterium]